MVHRRVHQPARDGVDTDDLVALGRHIGIDRSTAAIELVEAYSRPHPLKPATRFLLEELFPPGR